MVSNNCFKSGVLFAILTLTLSSRSVSLAEAEVNDIRDSVERRSLSDLDLDILDSSYFDESNEDIEKKKENVADTEAEAFEEPLVIAKKAPCLGCPQHLDTEDDKIRDIGLFAFGDYVTKAMGQSDSDDDLMETFIRVLKAERQIVAGVKYILKVELGWSNCSKSVYRDGPEDCSLDTSKPTFTCDFHVVEKSWENTKEVVFGRCEKDEVESEVINDKTADNDGVAPTLEDDEDDLDDEIISEDWEKRRKREALLGEVREAKEDKEKIMEIAKFAMEELDKVDEDNLARLVVDILSANKQTVSGWLYHLKIRVAQTSCEENSGATLEKCEDKILLPFQRCEVKVLFQPWQTVQRKLVHSQCVKENYKTSKKVAKQLFSTLHKQSKRSKKAVIGGGSVVDTGSEDIADLVEFAIDSIDQMSNALHVQKLVRVVYAEQQRLDDGASTKLILELGYTKCRKNPTLDKSTCSIDEKRDHQYCNVTIVEKSSIKQKKMTSSKCGKREEVLERRTKREAMVTDFDELDADQLEFGQFLETFGKKYSSEEYEKRLTIFKDNMEKAKLFQKTEQGTAVYGATMFADLTQEEFTSRHLGLRIDLKQRMKRKHAKIPIHATLPEAFDWRNYSAVTPVKDQGVCGSCWAFSVTGNIEGLYAIKHGKLLSFSEQELVDCDKLDDGCNGGLPENAYKAIQKLGGLETEANYPYDGHDDKCAFNRSLAAAQVTGFVEVSKNETDMAAWLVKNGPMSIGINANAMQLYFGGVSHPWKFLCSPKNLDHGVLIVGYGVHSASSTNKHKTLPYWIVKNSWGPRWGEKGYYRIYRGDGSCGVNQMTTSAYVA